MNASMMGFRWQTNPEWYTLDPLTKKYKMTDKAPKWAVDDFKYAHMTRAEKLAFRYPKLRKRLSADHKTFI